MLWSIWEAPHQNIHSKSPKTLPAIMPSPTLECYTLCCVNTVVVPRKRMTTTTSGHALYESKIDSAAIVGYRI